MPITPVLTQETDGTVLGEAGTVNVAGCGPMAVANTPVGCATGRSTVRSTRFLPVTLTVNCACGQRPSPVTRGLPTLFHVPKPIHVASTASFSVAVNVDWHDST